MNIPKCMSTQHPDNVNVPFFASDPELGGEDEVIEAYYAFSHMGCDEQMWDCEGKEVDSYVVKKLLTTYEPFFRARRLGEDVFLTLRVPNPTVEKHEAKVLIETLESIPRSYDAARLFYGEDIAPIFEVILPMTNSSRCLGRIYTYYSDFVVGKQTRPFSPGDITVAEWIGDFKPERINVIPLFEDMEHLLAADTITGEYLAGKDVSYQRVFLARSDPAMNYGLVSAVLLSKIALKKLDDLATHAGVPIYPIIGAGSAPFRGNLKPDNVLQTASDYPSAHTFSLQSAFKYDYNPDEVLSGVRRLHERTSEPPQDIDIDRCLDIIARTTLEYQRQMLALAPLINETARYVPSRRKRKLHVGLFGYARSTQGVSLPRAIKFTSALYSLGLPPELLGMNALTRDDLKFLRQVYVNFDNDLNDAFQYLNLRTGLVPPELEKVAHEFPVTSPRNVIHEEITGQVASAIRDGRSEMVADNILRAASIRRFLG